jgi:hypothetical protein
MYESDYQAYLSSPTTTYSASPHLFHTHVSSPFLPRYYVHTLDKQCLS